MKTLARSGSGYWEMTRNPLVCVLFVLPLLVAYEAGMHLADGARTSARNGADVWVRELLTGFGFVPLAAPALILLVLLCWGLWRRQGLPHDPFGVALGMTLESGLFAVGLFGLSQALAPFIALLQGSGLMLSTPPLRAGLDPTVQQILRYLGAGLYEETLFRLLLFSGLWLLFLCWDMPAGLALLLAGFCSALGFAAAHHLGPHGEVFHPLIFLFRTLAGGYFACLFHLRGFGIAVGTHAGYDVLVGLMLR